MEGRKEEAKKEKDESIGRKKVVFARI